MTTRRPERPTCPDRPSKPPVTPSGRACDHIEVRQRDPRRALASLSRARCASPGDVNAPPPRPGRVAGPVSVRGPDRGVSRPVVATTSTCASACRSAPDRSRSPHSRPSPSTASVVDRHSPRAQAPPREPHVAPWARWPGNATCLNHTFVAATALGPPRSCRQRSTRPTFMQCRSRPGRRSFRRTR